VKGTNYEAPLYAVSSSYVQRIYYPSEYTLHVYIYNNPLKEVDILASKNFVRTLIIFIFILILHSRLRLDFSKALSYI
jgi:hypothetical protein